MRLRRGARKPASESVPAPQPAEAPAATPQHHDSLVYELLANVALRDLTVIERILSVISDVERGEQDPERLSLYYALDHDVTRLRRSAENALVLAGAQAPMGRAEPMSLLDVARAAASESADYARVSVGRLPQVAVGPAVADDLAHTLAELVDNALSVSPTRAKVNVTGTRASGGVLVAVEDEGIGIAPERLPDLNTRLTGPLVLDTASTRQMGLYVVAHLARRHGIYVQLQSRKQLGSTAVAFLPDRLLLESSVATQTRSAAAAPAPDPASAPPALIQRVPARPPFAQRPSRGYQHGTSGGVGPVQRAARPEPAAEAEARARSQQAEFGGAAAAPSGRHASPAPAPQAEAPMQQHPNPYVSPNPYVQQGGVHTQQNGAYAQQGSYAGQQPYPNAAQDPLTGPLDEPEPDVTAPMPPMSRPTGQLARRPTSAPVPMAAPLPVPMQPAEAQLPPRFSPQGVAPTPPPVAPATVDRWAPTSQERAQPTAFTDQGLPRRTRPSTPRAFPGPAPREAKPADPDSVLADLEAFASGAADAALAGAAPAPDQDLPSEQWSATPIPPPLPTPRFPTPPPMPPAPAPPPLLTDPAQEEF